jgi:hypothetical protein
MLVKDWLFVMWRLLQFLSVPSTQRAVPGLSAYFDAKPVLQHQRLWRFETGHAVQRKSPALAGHAILFIA